MLDTSKINQDESEKSIMDYTPNPSNQSQPTKTVDISSYKRFRYDWGWYELENLLEDISRYLGFQR